MSKKRNKANQNEILGELWKDIIGFEGYYKISNMGRVKSLNARLGDLIMAGGTCEGYKNIKLTINYKNTYFRIHKLVALHFISNPENKPFVNHKNGVKNDNRVENLEWCTQSENTQHAYDTGLQKPPHLGSYGSNHPSSKLVLDTQTGIFYETRNEAAWVKGMPSNTLSNQLTGKVRNKTSFIYV